jgi:hypothetical protein
MPRLRQTQSPAQRANWTEYFYSGELKVVNGEVETDNENWVHQLLARGFSEVNDDTLDNVEVLGEVVKEPEVEPQPVLDPLPSMPTSVDEATDEPATESAAPKPVTEPVSVSEPEYIPEPAAKEDEVAALAPTEPSPELADLMAAVLEPTPKRTPPKPRRKNLKGEQ